ncbi:hypothetical protein [Pedobacter nutrimenti]|uniref:hypothetical protein n=1 Tax=Pedobacter nutrimenti TaxID=1241337 RepID=UPI0029309CAF|nr:hypothetical protein [Pedobacter nutrimenti]
MKTIPTYILNLENRTDKKHHILKEFAGRAEFSINIIAAEECETGAIDLWNTIKYILQNLVPSEEEYIIICADDHVFTESYNEESLIKAIIDAQKKEAAVLIGGVSWFDTALQISPGLFVIDKFLGLQFAVIYRKFFNAILEADFGPNDVADYKIFGLTEDKLLIYPFMSAQKEFGHSDITPKNNNGGHVTQIPNDSSAILKVLNDIALFYELDVAK